jgi:hypothetical protein
MNSTPLAVDVRGGTSPAASDHTPAHKCPLMMRTTDAATDHERDLAGAGAASSSRRSEIPVT